MLECSFSVDVYSAFILKHDPGEGDGNWPVDSKFVVKDRCLTLAKACTLIVIDVANSIPQASCPTITDLSKGRCVNKVTIVWPEIQA